MSVSVPASDSTAPEQLSVRTIAAGRSSGVSLWTIIPLFGLLTVCGSTARAQQAPGQYFPLKQDAAPGVAGGWAGTIRPGLSSCFQHIRVEVPTEGVVTYYGDQGAEYASLAAPSLMEFLVGPVYRLKLSEMPEYPGIELFPTVELISRLHPPPGREREFPVPITFTEKEIELVLQGRLVTKVVYLEQPNIAYPGMLAETAPTQIVSNTQDALQRADELGRPMAIVRLGRRSLPQGSYEFSPAPPLRRPIEVEAKLPSLKRSTEIEVLPQPVKPSVKSTAKPTVKQTSFERLPKAKLSDADSPLVSDKRPQLPPTTRPTLPANDLKPRVRLSTSFDIEK